MMDTKELTDRQKSVLLARAMGWAVRHVPTESSGASWSRGYYEIMDADGERIPLRVLFEQGTGFDSYPYKVMPGLSDFDVLDLYSLSNMPLAWGVMNWAAERDDELDDYGYPYTLKQGVEELFDTGEYIEEQLWALPPGEAVRKWLDAVLAFCLKVFLVELV